MSPPSSHATPMPTREMYFTSPFAVPINMAAGPPRLPVPDPPIKRPTSITIPSAKHKQQRSRSTRVAEGRPADASKMPGSVLPPMSGDLVGPRRITPTPKTELFITCSTEIRGDKDVYMFNIDKCYTTHEQANARVRLLGECNFSLKVGEKERQIVRCDAVPKLEGAGVGPGKDGRGKEEVKLQTVVWCRRGSEAMPRFVASAMQFEIEDANLGQWEDVKPNSDCDASSLFFHCTDLDLPSHIWVVAVYQPGSLWSTEKLWKPAGKTTPPEHRSNAVEQEDIPSAITGWHIDSVHHTSFKAMARAKQAWNEVFMDKVGRCQKVREHYGFARLALRPAPIGKDKKLSSKSAPRYHDADPQIRIERVKVNSATEKPEYFIAPPLFSELASNRTGSKVNVEVKIMVDPPLKRVDGEIISTAEGKRTAFLQDLEEIANEALQPSFGYHEPLALQPRQRKSKGWGELEDQRFGAGSGSGPKGGEDGADGVGEVKRNSDVYHGFLHRKWSEGGKAARLRSKAFVRAQARMKGAVEGHRLGDRVAVGA
ncbi:hypothetical protein LTR62_005376 [Meristemomyces frigidus]|uniref:Uncharacterized protein n=1 Tax=Meristemomyces frigidus TaxID=1508187 RepID=A0AAN7TGX6_9PEZI|nr:hypothetical protein LTR62_005376 [Meristemomyces frigidus]